MKKKSQYLCSPPISGETKVVLALCGLLAAITAAPAANVFKANNTDDLNLGTSWSGGLTPGAGDVGVWDSTVTGPNTTLLATNSAWSGLRVTSPGGLITINATATNANAGATLTLGSAGLDLSVATQDLTFGAPVGLAVGTAQTWIAGTGRTLTLNGALTRAATGNSGTINFDASLGGTVTVASGTASTLLLGGNSPFATINGADYASLDGSKNVTAGVSFYGDYNAGGTINGTYASPILNITGTTAGATQAWRQGNTFTVPNGVRFPVANSQNIKWTVDTSNAGRLLTTGAILIGPGVGTQDVEFNGSGGVRANGNSQDLILFHYGSGNLIFNTTITVATGSSASPLVKTGPGRVVLAVANSYTGPTRIEQGSLLVNGSTTTNSAVSVSNGATLGGSGLVGGSVTVASGGTIAAGNTNGAGTLTVGGPVTLSAGTTFLSFYGPTTATTNTAALLNLTNNLTINGTVNVSVLSGAVSVGQYPLVKWTNAIPAATFNLVAIQPHVSAYLSNNAANSSLDLVVTSNNQPLKWATGSGTWDINGAPNWKDAVGTSTTYQQVGPLEDSVIFEDSLSGASPIAVTLNTTVRPSSLTVNATKNFSISGSGAIVGPTGLTKQSAGTLTLSTVNSFVGAVNLNGGTVIFSALENLGAVSAPINFGGSALQYASGNTADISTHTVTINAGGAVINDGGNVVNYVNPIGNGGAGGLTKTGSGTLTLNGTNRYSGNTLISQGTLAIGPSSSLSNSAAIIVSGGSVFDATQNGGITLSTATAQLLAGAGTVSGPVTVPNATTITPGTNGVTGTLAVNGDLSFNGGTYACDLSTISGDLINVSGNLTLASGTIVLNVSGSLVNGSYKLIQYSGAIVSGSAANLTIVGFSQPGKAVTLSDATPGEIDLIVSSTASDNLTWAGVSTDWDLAGSLNWLKSGLPWAFTNGSFVTFDDTGAGQPSVSLKASLSPSTVTVAGSATYTFVDGTGVGGGKVSGAATITKNGSGTLLIDTVNDNTGPTVINGGALQVGDGVTTGALGSGNITNNAALLFLQTDSRMVVGQISGVGSLTQQGSATLTLANNNTYSGPTTISSGTLQIGNGGATGSLGTADVQDDGTLAFNRSGIVTVANAISGAGGLTKTGNGTLTLTASNGYAGLTAVTGGKLIMGSAVAHAGNGALQVQAAGTNDMNGFNLTVARLNSTLGAGGRLVNNAGTATNILTINYDGTGTADSSVLIADNDGSGGKIAVVKTGTGSQIMRGTSTFTGGTVISNGTLNVRSDVALSTGQVTLRGGNLSFAGITFGNAVVAETNATLDTPGNANVTLTGSFTTTSNLTFIIDNNETFTFNGAANQLGGVSGTIFISTGPGFFRFNGSRGSAAATFDLTGSAATINSAAVGAFELGALVGDSTSFLSANPGSTFVIGGKNLSTTYGGTFANVNNSLVKVGTGMLTLTGTYSFTNSTTISNGVLALMEPISLDSSPTIAVRAAGTLDVSGRADGTLNLGNSVAQTLGGAGTINGNVTATGGAVATIAPGETIGTLHITNALTLAANSVVLMELNRTNATGTNDMIICQSYTINSGASLTVTNVGPNLVNGDTFKLFNVGVPGFTVTLPAADSTGTNLYVWNDQIAANGTIQLVSGGTSPVATNPTNITFQVVSGQMIVSWPMDHTGWRLQSQTNVLAAGLKTNWVEVAGSTATNQISLPIATTNSAVFFRLISP